MKKFMFIITIFTFTLLCGCTFNSSQYINLSKKTSNNYYTNALYEKIQNGDSYTINIFDTNVYKNITVPKEENHIISNFITSLNEADYVSSLENSEKEPYRMQIVFDDGNKYLIKVFNNESVSISPWDGVYNEDYINIKNVPLAYNLFDFCNHIHDNMSK